MTHPHGHSHPESPGHRGMPKMPSWISVEEALARILDVVPVLDSTEKSLLEALGYVLAEDLRSPIDVPPAANTSMDGYALQEESVRGATSQNPANLRVRGNLAAGHVSPVRVGLGEALRIMTGAPIPMGADVVVPFEDTDELERMARGGSIEGEIRVLKAPRRGDNIRLAGEDIRKGALVLTKGSVLRPAEIGVCASVGKATLRVVRRPVVAILATGDELVAPSGELRPGQIYDSNSYGVATSVLKYGGIPKMLGIAKDNLESLEAKVEDGAKADLLITSAGVSRGDYDIVKDLLMKKGDISFWSVRMRPAKPLAFGVLRRPGLDGGKVPHLGLPGNPVSAMVAFEEFARPAILKMQGRTAWAKPTIEATLEDSIHNTDGRRVYARVWVEKREGRYFAKLTGSQGSGVLTSVARANGLAICPEHLAVRNPGDLVEVQMIDWLETQA